MNYTLIGLVLPNDGIALQERLFKHYGKVQVRHIGNYVFTAHLEDGSNVIIYTDPVNEEGQQIRIVDVHDTGVPT